VQDPPERAPDDRQVGQIGRAKTGVGRPVEVERQHNTARPSTRDFINRRLELRHIPQTVSGGHEID
jgi:hypothetical protein